MKAEGLLAHYARFADAPDAIARLRRFVLDLAVRGKLVAQNATDEPAYILVQNIRRAKAEAGGGNASIALDENDRPFGLPKSWAWARLGEVCSKTGSGSTPRGGQSAYKQNGIPFLRSQNVYDDGLRLEDVAYIDIETHQRMRATAVRPGDLLLNITGGSMGRCCLVPNHFKEANISQHVAIIRPAVEGMSEFLHRVVMSPYFQAFIFDEQTGAGRGGLPKNRMDRIVIALPPLTEQRRIIAKVDELMILCDQLEAARTKREAVRDRLTAASVDRLKAPKPDTFRADVRLALDALSALTARPDQIKQLRQTILNFAVRGKLVSADSNDEPVEVLLERIARERSIVSGKRTSARDFVQRGSYVGNVPNGWALSSLGELSTRLHYGFTASADEKERAVRLLRITDIQDNRVNWETVPGCLIDPKVLPGYLLERGDILIARTGGTIGKSFLVADVPVRSVFASYLIRVQPAKALFDRYLKMFCESGLYWDQLLDGARGAGQPNVNGQTLSKVEVPLPPLPEQHRIVAKVDELIALCDRLEGSLVRGEVTRRSLLDALLHEALEPASEPAKRRSRAAISSYVVSRLASKRNFGRTAHMKYLYLAEARLGLDLGGHFMREAAGPLDTGIYDLEKQAEAEGWYTHKSEMLSSGNDKVSYMPGCALAEIAGEGIIVLGSSRAEMDRLLDLMGGLKTEKIEIIASLFAAWNDALLDGHSPDDDWIIKEVREHWHIRKQRFSPNELLKWLGWMRQNDIVPLGHPPRTIQQTKMDL